MFFSFCRQDQRQSRPVNRVYKSLLTYHRLRNWGTTRVEDALRELKELQADVIVKPGLTDLTHFIYEPIKEGGRVTYHPADGPGLQGISEMLFSMRKDGETKAIGYIEQEDSD